MTVLAQGAGGQRGDIIAFAGDNDARSHPEFT